MTYTKKDHDLRKLFEEARRTDSAQAPPYQPAEPDRIRGARPWWIPATLLGAAGAVALAAVSWLALQPPLPDAPGMPSAVRTESAERTVESTAELTPESTPESTPEGVAESTLESTPVVVAEAVTEVVAETVAEADPQVEPATPPSVTLNPTVEQRREPELPTVAEAASPRPTPPLTTARRSTAPTGGIEIRVADSSGSLPGATVVISHPSGFVKTTAIQSDRDGKALFPVLRSTGASGAGYDLIASFPGLSSVRQSDVKVLGGVVVDLPIQLTEEMVERVEVVAQTEVVDLQKTVTATRFSDKFISDLPVPGRFYQNVVTLSPGAQDSDSGSRDRDFKAEVSGVSNVDPLTGQHMSQVNREPSGTESYAAVAENPFRSVADHPMSTFSIDVDTASYSNVRRFLNEGRRPPADAVRIEELVNYFSYDYPEPTGDAPFSVNVEIADCPWEPRHRLARVGLKGRSVARGESAGSNLVFLIDVSGSMQQPQKLPLLKTGLSMLVRQLTSMDQVAIVVYAGASGMVLPPTSGSDQGTILAALQRLRAGGSTNGAAGLKLAYRTAREEFIPGGVNRVILATDGDFNVGVTSHSELLDLIREDARRGIFLTTLGFGYGNLKDDRLETLANKGNGNYAYIDNREEARKVLVEELYGTLVTIAKDVKIQIEFNPLEVASYRLIGYENRMLAKEDFNDDRKDAGEIGSGHTVTALYELVPAGEPEIMASVDPLRYQTVPVLSEQSQSGEALLLKLRYKEPEGQTSRLLEYPIVDNRHSLEEASSDFRFAASVAGFGMLLRDSSHCAWTFEDVEREARGGAAADARGYRTEFLQLVRAAQALGRDGR